MSHLVLLVKVPDTSAISTQSQTFPGYKKSKRNHLSLFFSTKVSVLFVWTFALFALAAAAAENVLYVTFLKSRRNVLFFCTKKLLVPAAPATTAHEVAACEESAEAEQALSEKGETQQND